MNGLTCSMKSSGKYERWEEGECTLHRWPKSWEICTISTISRASLTLRKYVFTKIWKVQVAITASSLYIWKKIPSGFHTRKNSRQQYLKVVTFSDPSFSKECIYVNNHAVYVIHWTDHPVHEKVLILGKN